MVSGRKTAFRIMSNCHSISLAWSNCSGATQPTPTNVVGKYTSMTNVMTRMVIESLTVIRVIPSMDLLCSYDVFARAQRFLLCSCATRWSFNASTSESILIKLAIFFSKYRVLRAYAPFWRMRLRSKVSVSRCESELMRLLADRALLKLISPSKVSSYDWKMYSSGRKQLSMKRRRVRVSALRRSCRSKELPNIFLDWTSVRRVQSPSVLQCLRS